MELNMKKIMALTFILFLISKVLLAQDAKPQRIPSDQLKQTVVTSYLQDNIVAGKNLLYCSTFQIAWDTLSDDIIKEPLQLEGNPLAVENLNKRLTGKQDISEDCYLAMAGFNKDGITEKIKQALKEKFNETPGIDINLTRPDDILAYSFLLKDLKFKNEFENLENPILFNGVIAVKAFGISKYNFDEAHKKLGEQVTILDYKNDDDFIVSLKSISPNDEIILAKIVPKQTMLETLDSLFARISSAILPPGLNGGDTLQIPKLDFDLLHSYSELTGKHALNKGFEDYFISKAIQTIRFRLNEKGALLKSEVVIVMELGLEPEPPKRLVFNKPFLICLREKGAKYPYFAMWVDNAELLLKE